MKKTHRKNPAAVALGRLGGKVTGPAKRRSPEQCRQAGLASAKKRWGFKPNGEKP